MEASPTKVSEKNMSPADLVRKRQRVLEINRVAAKGYRKRKRDKEMILRDRVDQLEREAKMYRQESTE